MAAKAALPANIAAAAEMVAVGLEAGRSAKAATAGNLAMATAAETEGPLGVCLGTAAKAPLAGNMAMAVATVAQATKVATELLALAMAAKAAHMANMAKAPLARLAVPAIPTKTVAVAKAPTALGLRLSRRANAPAEAHSRARQAVRTGLQVKRTHLRRSRNQWRQAHPRSQLDRPPL